MYSQRQLERRIRYHYNKGKEDARKENNYILQRITLTTLLITFSFTLGVYLVSGIWWRL